MLFKNLPPGSKFIFTESIKHSDGERLDLGIITYIKIEEPVCIASHYNGIKCTAINPETGHFFSVGDDDEVLFIR